MPVACQGRSLEPVGQGLRLLVAATAAVGAATALAAAVAWASDGPELPFDRGQQVELREGLPCLLHGQLQRSERSGPRPGHLVHDPPDWALCLAAKPPMTGTGQC